MSKTYRRPPSDLYYIRDEVSAYYFNRAVALFGMTVDQELEEASESSKNKGQAARKRQLVLMKYFGVQGAQFRDPAASSKPSEIRSDKASGPVKL